MPYPREIIKKHGLGYERFLLEINDAILHETDECSVEGLTKLKVIMTDLIDYYIENVPTERQYVYYLDYGGDPLYVGNIRRVYAYTSGNGKAYLSISDYYGGNSIKHKLYLSLDEALAAWNSHHSKVKESLEQRLKEVAELIQYPKVELEEEDFDGY